MYIHFIHTANQSRKFSAPHDSPLPGAKVQTPNVDDDEYVMLKDAITLDISKLINYN